MKTESFSTWFFPVTEAPVEVLLPHSSTQTRLPLPHHKALIDEESGRVLGVVGSNYLVITNTRAVELAREVAGRAFPDIASTEWQLARATGPATRSHVHLDLVHPTHVMNLWDNEGGPSEVYTPFLRVTNSYNRARALRFDFGYMRRHCSNGVVFEEQVASLSASHSKRDLNRLGVKVATVRFDGLAGRFTAMVRSIRAIDLDADQSLEAARLLLSWPAGKPGDPDARREEVGRLDHDLTRRHNRYRAELGPNAYALFNTLTDIAARPPESRLYRRDRATIERTAGRWLKQVAEASSKPGFRFGEHLGLMTRDRPAKRSHRAATLQPR